MKFYSIIGIIIPSILYAAQSSRLTWKQVETTKPYGLYIQGLRGTPYDARSLNPNPEANCVIHRTDAGEERIDEPSTAALCIVRAVNQDRSKNKDRILSEIERKILRFVLESRSNIHATTLKAVRDCIAQDPESWCMVKKDESFAHDLTTLP